MREIKTFGDVIPQSRSETELLFLCARTYLGTRQQKQIQHLLQQDLNWAKLIQLADQHGVMPLVCQTLQKFHSVKISTSALTSLETRCQISTARNLFLLSKLIQIQQLLDQHQIPAIFFKGPVLAMMAYGNLALRQIGDLDLWVSENDFSRITDLMVSLGYESTVDVPWEIHLSLSDQLGSYSLDIHRDLVPQHLAKPFTVQDLTSYSTSFCLMGQTVTTLSPEFQLLVLCLNGTKECWRRLNRVCDIAELIRAHPNLDWKQIMTLTQQRGEQRLLRLGLLLAYHLLDAPLPVVILKQIQSDPVAQLLFWKVRQQMFLPTLLTVGEVERTIFYIKTRERFTDQIRTLVGLLQHSGWMIPTANDREAISLPACLSFFYYLIRPIRVIRKYFSCFS